MSAEKNKGTSAASKPSKTCSDIVADWLIVYGKVYREELSEELALAYQLCLKETRDGQALHLAFTRAMKQCKFRPTPAEVLAAYEVELEEKYTERPKWLAEPKLSEQERTELLQEPKYQALRERLLLRKEKP